MSVINEDQFGPALELDMDSLQSEQDQFSGTMSGENAEPSPSQAPPRKKDKERDEDAEINDLVSALEETEADTQEPDESDDDETVEDEHAETNDLLLEEEGDDDEPEDESDLIDESDSHGVKKRISKVLKQKKAMERENAELRAQLQRSSYQPAAQQVPQQQQNVYQGPQFVPPPLPEGQDLSTMTPIEQMLYAIQVDKAHTQHLENQRRVQTEQNRHQKVIDDTVSDLTSYESRLKNPEDRKVVHELLHGQYYFSAPMILALESYPNRAQILTYLHKTQGSKLMAHHNSSPVQQAAEMVKMAERFNSERAKLLAAKAVKKKAPPPGKIRGHGGSTLHAALKSTNSSKRDDYINSLPVEKMLALSAKGLI